MLGTLVQIILFLGFISALAIRFSATKRKEKLFAKYGESITVWFKNGLKGKGISKPLNHIEKFLKQEDESEYNSIKNQYRLSVSVVFISIIIVIICSLLFNFGVI